jgi:hypothetical protein
VPVGVPHDIAAGDLVVAHHSVIAFRPAAVIFTRNTFGRSDPRSVASPAQLFLTQVRHVISI